MTNFEWVVYQYGTVTLKVWVLVEVDTNINVELTTSRFIMGQNDKVVQIPKSIYLNPNLTYGFRSVLSDYFNHCTTMLLDP